MSIQLPCQQFISLLSENISCLVFKYYISLSSTNQNISYCDWELRLACGNWIYLNQEQWELTLHYREKLYLEYSDWLYLQKKNSFTSLQKTNLPGKLFYLLVEVNQIFTCTFTITKCIFQTPISISLHPPFKYNSYQRSADVVKTSV